MTEEILNIVRAAVDSSVRETAKKAAADCGKCAYHDAYTGVCFNHASPKCADFTDDEYYCRAFEAKKTEGDEQ